jgi:peptide-methionine (S)-S-oxide reductase
MTKKATFAAGCFWGVEASFRRVKGILSTQVGYSGGHVANPSYREVCTGKTGHAESVRLEYDPDLISYEELLEIFWDIHDPTSSNRQGPDIGSQYRSVIFYHDEDQRKSAKKSVARLQRSGEYKRDIVTEIVPAAEFYPAEDYHQRYYEKQGILH